MSAEDTGIEVTTCARHRSMSTSSMQSKPWSCHQSSSMENQNFRVTGTMSKSACQEPVIEQAVNTLRRGLPFVQNGMQYTLDTAASLLEFDAEETDKIKCLKVTMLSFCNTQREMEQFEAAAKHVMAQAKLSREPMDLEAMFDEKLAELQRSNTAKGLEQHEKYSDLEELIQNAVQPAEAEGTTEVQLDDDLAISQAQMNTKCPVTMQEMKKPMRNRHCGHNYDYDGARQLIRNRQQARCPVSGCVNDKPLKLADLEENKELKRLIERKNRKTAKTSSKS